MLRFIKLGPLFAFPVGAAAAVLLLPSHGPTGLLSITHRARARAGVASRGI